MLVYYFVPFIVSNRYLLFWDSNSHNSVTVQNRTHVYMNLSDHKDLGNHLLQLCPKVEKNSMYVCIYIYICYVTLHQKMSNRVKSHDIPGQGIGPALSTQHCCSSFKSLFISKNHHTWGFELLTPHKQNPHQEINQLPVTAKIFSQPGIQLCVATVAVQLWQTDCHGLLERLSWLVQHSCLIWTQIILWFATDEKNIPVTIWCSKPVTQRANVSVFGNRRHCCLSACSPTVWL